MFSYLMSLNYHYFKCTYVSLAGTNGLTIRFYCSGEFILEVLKQYSAILWWFCDTGAITTFIVVGAVGVDAPMLHTLY